MEYYFGNKNFYQDNFLLKHQEKFKNKRFIPIDLILTFNKMKQLTQSVDKIVQVLENSDVVDISDDKKQIRKRSFNPRFVRIDENKEDNDQAQTAKNQLIS